MTKNPLLDPKDIRLERAPDQTLRAYGAEFCAMDVQVLRAMPLSMEDRFIVLRDGGGREIALVESLDDLQGENRRLVELALRERYFLPQIEKINNLTERFGTSTWDVETDRGHIVIQSKAMHEAISEIGPGRYLLRDMEENRYEIRDVNALDPVSQQKFLGRG